jgi:hypothetical protein
MRRFFAMMTAVVALVGFSASVLAEDTIRFKPARDAIEVSGLKIVKEETGKDFRGNPALILKTDKRMKDVVEMYKKLYREQTKIGTATVVGLAHVVHSDSWNITLKEGNSSVTFKVREEDNGSNITIREPMTAPKRRK